VQGRDHGGRGVDLITQPVRSVVTVASFARNLARPTTASAPRSRYGAATPTSASSSSQYVEVHYARRLFADDARGVGYLLKDRITEVGEFLTALDRVATGGSALDPESSPGC
jgi:hypothetical protein